MSKIKVNEITVRSGCTVTLGESGKTVALASGASQTGFGRTGTVDWQTGSIKTGTFTAANGEGYFVDTSSGSVTANLPAGSAGAIVSFQDYKNTFDTNSFIITPNGTEKINSGSGRVVLATEGEGVTLVYIDGTVGWRSIQDSAFADTGSNFILATGGTVTTCGDCKIHTFTSPGTFTVCAVAVCAAQNVMSHLVVAGGGGGGGNNSGDSDSGGGGGAGGYREVKSPVTPYTASPLDGYPSSPNRVTITATSFPITVGAGGAASPGAPGGGLSTSGSNSIFSTITSAGGGRGGTQFCSGAAGVAGGSGGGGSGTSGGAGNTPPVSPAQGFAGGEGSGGPTKRAGGGGGGATAVGTDFGPPATAGSGGAGATSSINGTPTARAGGGGGGGQFPQPATNGGAGGGGPSSDGTQTGTAGTANTGGGGGGNGRGPSAPAVAAGGAGGSGIVIIRYKFQQLNGN